MDPCPRLRWMIAASLALAALACRASPSAPTDGSSPVADVTLVGAGDIVVCGAPEAEATASLLDRIEGTVVSLGDNQYPSATADLLTQCYTPTWGRHVRRMLAVPGNHDWEVSSGAPFFAYFGPAAGPGGLGYFSTTLGAWHVIGLNSNIAAGPGSPQYEWLKTELARSKAACTVAMWHHPLFSSGLHGTSPQMRDVWRLLQEAGADVVLTGHDHDYERFAPQDADGRRDPRGIREFVVGTGGAALRDRFQDAPNSEVSDYGTFGVLRLTLRSGGYAWQFVPVAGQTFSDSGTAGC